ncbi:hypothetical protein [Rhizobium multihospitium]|uniref:Uncharacterized protein n=1 Tax=Rhizobium multihospitium TaxID=410764 RepID=A0A1C3XBV4_9HYPH|nr:hypothetical protein [Rhizobium multihospitium]SCB49691.1 hypothetical protein GA0061103_0662 [Rhizobium multihospitium]
MRICRTLRLLFLSKGFTYDLSHYVDDFDPGIFGDALWVESFIEFCSTVPVLGNDAASGSDRPVTVIGYEQIVFAGGTMCVEWNVIAVL